MNHRKKLSFLAVYNQACFLDRSFRVQHLFGDVISASITEGGVQRLKSVQPIAEGAQQGVCIGSLEVAMKVINHLQLIVINTGET